MNEDKELLTLAAKAAGFTPGPWVARIGNGIEVCGSDAVAIAEIWLRGNRELETANAHLIAAAPELYEALDCFPGFTDDAIIGDSWIEVMRAALIKARGEKC